MANDNSGWVKIPNGRYAYAIRIVGDQYTLSSHTISSKEFFKRKLRGEPVGTYDTTKQHERNIHCKTEERWWKYKGKENGK